MIVTYMYDLEFKDAQNWSSVNPGKYGGDEIHAYFYGNNNRTFI